MKPLFVLGGWEGHEPKQCVGIFATFLRGQGFEVEVSDTLGVCLDEDKTKSLDLAAPVWAMGTITNDQERGLLDTIKRGIGEWEISFKLVIWQMIIVNGRLGASKHEFDITRRRYSL